VRRISIVAALVLAADLLTKWLVGREVPLQAGSVRVLGDVVRFINVRNSGSAFSLFQGGRIFFIAFSVVSIILILALARSPRCRNAAAEASLGMILGGALGNTFDRVVSGAVTDWIDVGIGSTRWPTFNVADIGVTVGVILLVLVLLRAPANVESAEDAEEEPRNADGPA
jgi:signal peptidase II